MVRASACDIQIQKPPPNLFIVRISVLYYTDKLEVCAKEMSSYAQNVSILESERLYSNAMKIAKKVLLISGLLLSGFSNGQSYHPFTTNIGWCVEENFSLGAIMIDYLNLGDTIISGKNYTFLGGKGSDFFLVREDTVQKKVWVILPNDTSESLLYDFNLLKGQQISLNFAGLTVAYTVDSTYTTSTLTGNRLRIDMTTTDTNLAPTLSWIEGVGSAYGPIYLHEQTSLKAPAFISYCLICSYSDTAVRSYSGSCMIPCESMYLQPCFSFISGVASHDKSKAKLNTSFINENELSVRVNIGKIIMIRVFSTDGRLMDKIEAEDQEVIIDSQNWPTGIYLIEVTMYNGSIVSAKIKK